MRTSCITRNLRIETWSIDIGELSNICADLGTTARKLFDPSASTPSITPEHLVQKVTAFLDREKMPLTEFEDRVNHTIGDALAEPGRVMAWNLELLQNVCREIGIAWTDALPDCGTIQKYFTSYP